MVGWWRVGCVVIVRWLGRGRNQHCMFVSGGGFGGVWVVQIVDMVAWDEVVLRSKTAFWQ